MSRAKPTTAAIGGMVREAAPSASEMRQVTGEMRQVQEQGTHRIRKGEQYYPQVTYPRNDEQDENFRIREALLEANKGRGYIHPIDQSDVEYWRSKQEIQEGALFKQWCTTKFNLEDPANQRLFEQIMPSYITDQEEYLKQRFELALRHCLIKIRGIRDIEDLKFMWAVETGRISIPAGFAADTISTGIDKPFGTKVKPAYVAGLFNPLRYVDTEIAPQGGGYGKESAYNVMLQGTNTAANTPFYYGRSAEMVQQAGTLAPIPFSTNTSTVTSYFPLA